MRARREHHMMHGQVKSLRKCIFLLAGAAVVLLGFQQDPRDTAPGAFEPSPVDLQDEAACQARTTLRASLTP
jgi:hypothetical protein